MKHHAPVPHPGCRLPALDQRAAAIVEMALVLPLLLTLMTGILVYGQYFRLAHSVQQAANDGARAAIVGLDPADRRGIAERAVDRSLTSIAGLEARNRSITVSETADAITVAVAYAVPPASLLRSTFVPPPANVIRADATFELPEE